MTVTDATIGSVTSADGTSIGYRRLGQGPGVLLLHGAMESAQSHIQLATALADSFTVYLPDRRGRGLSGPYPGDYGIRTEIEDMRALLAGTGARNVFGVSSGGIVCLHAALALSSIDKAAIFEPPLFLDPATPAALLARFDRELSEGRLAAALVTGMKGAQMGPAIFNAIPRRLLERLTTMAMAQDDKNRTEAYVPMRALAPTLRYDFQLVADASGSQEHFRAMRTRTLLLGGGKSPAYLKRALDALQQVLPDAARVEFPRLNHAASGNADRGGRPERVAQELRTFFS